MLLLDGLDSQEIAEKNVYFNKYSLYPPEKNIEKTWRKEFQ
jgi:hypothetical protein